jgi:hypothetical protein
MLWHSKRGTSTLVFIPHIPKYSTHGLSAEETTATVCCPAFFSRSAPYLPIAALAMYQRAKKLQDLINDPTLFASLAEEQLEAYLVAINALSLVDQKNAWVLLPMPADQAHEVCSISLDVGLIFLNS